MQEIEVEKVVIKYKASDGTIFDTKHGCENHEKRLNGERITCPKCNGRGSYNFRTKSVLNELTFQYEDVPFSDTCSRCGGKGYLDRTVSWE